MRMADGRRTIEGGQPGANGRGKRSERGAPELVTVVIPVRNGDPHLAQQLEALSKQDYNRPWELLIVDNGSTDGTLAVARSWRDALPAMRFADASTRKSINHARNVGAWLARGDFLAFCDADDVVAPGWLSALVSAACDFDIVGGRVHRGPLNDVGSVHPGPASDGLPIKRDFLPCAPGGNCGIWSSVARELAWNEAFTFGSSDIEFCWRATLAAYRLGPAPEAFIWKRERLRLSAYIRQRYAYGVSDAQLFRHFRHLGMPREAPTAVIAEWAWLLRNATKLVRGPSSRREWLIHAARRAGRIAGSIRFRVLFP